METEEILSKKEEQLFTVALILGGLMAAFNSTNIYIALPAIMKHYDITMAVMQIAIVGFLTTNCLVMPACSYFMDRFSGRNVFMVGLGMLLVSSFFCMAAPNYSILVLGRLIQGAASGIIMTSTNALVYQIIVSERKLAISALVSAVCSLGIALGPSLSGFFIDAFGWKSIFSINVPILLVDILIAVKYIPYKSFPVGSGFDIFGVLTSTIGTVGILVGFNLGNSYGWFSPITLSCICGGSLFLLFFVICEIRGAEPMLNFVVFGYAGFVVAIIYNSFYTFAISSVSTFMPLFLQNVMGFNAMIAGIALIIPATCMAIATPFAAKLNKHFPNRNIIFVSAVITLIGTWKMSQFDLQTGIIGLIAVLSLRYIGLGLVTPLVNNFAMASVPSHYAAHSAAMFNWVRQLVFTISISLLTLLYDGHMIKYANEGVMAELGAIDQARYIESLAISDANLVNVIALLISLPMIWFFKEKILHEKTKIKRHKAVTKNRNENG